MQPDIGECWEWQGPRNRDGYGTSGKSALAHRVAYAQAFGEPGKLCVLHRCDNPPCVRPSHLFLGTQRDNVLDCMAKGRRVNVRGAKIANARLTDQQVREIRALYATGDYSQDQIATKFGVTQPNVSSIVRCRTWAHIGVA